MKVGIFGSEYQIERQNLIKRLFEKLREQEADIYVDSPFYTFLTDAFGFEPVVSGLLVGDEFDLDIALSVGGDGTFLRTAARVNKQDIPILGINTGRLGFLADVSSNEVEDTLDEIFKNYYKVEERTLLRLYTEDRAFRGYNYALNEIAVLKRDSSSMITIHTFLNGEYLTSYQADGLVVATPTGSTAYSLSAGGPAVEPTARNLIVSPICAHSVHANSYVLSPERTVTVQTEKTGYKPIFLSADGGRAFSLRNGDAVEIRRVSDSLYGTAPELIRHYIEIRGIGVIDVQQLFGMGSVQFDTELDLVVQLEKWVDGKFYDRLGLGEEMYSILGVKLPYMIIPVRPGRNLAGIVEIATMKNRQMKFGYNPARDFVDRVDRQIDALTRQSEEQK